MSDVFQNNITVGGTFTSEKITKLIGLMEANSLSLDENDSGVSREDLEHQIKDQGEALIIRGECSDSETGDFLDALKGMELDYHNEIGAEFSFDGEIRTCQGGVERHCTISAQSQIVVRLSSLEQEVANHPEQTLAETLKKMDMAFFRAGPQKTHFEESPAIAPVA